MQRKPFNWIEIDRSALEANLSGFRRLIGPDRKLLAMVKANAYGHGMLETAGLATAAGADWLGVHSLEEGAALRRADFDVPILVVGYVPLDDLAEAVELGLRLTVYNPETVTRLGEICRETGGEVRCHIKVETGTYRQGVPASQVLDFARRVRETPGLVLEGLSSHYANIEDTTDHSYARYQLENFRSVRDELEKNGIDVPIRHFSCSAAAMLFPETRFEMVRIGIAMYGLWPSRETYLSCLQDRREPIDLRPVLSWKARIAQIKSVPKGAMIGYGCTFKAGRTGRLAVIPVGYHDGYPRCLSNMAYVLIKGERAPLRGRVAMDFIVADVTDIPGVALEDEVVLIGTGGDDDISADALAAWEGTINYEIVSRINPGIPRVVK